MDTIQVTAGVEALRNRAAQLIKAGRIGAARPLLAAAQAIAPHSPELALIGARLALSTGATEQALLQLDNGIMAAPSDLALRKCRAEVRQRTGDLDGAARDAAEAVILDRWDMHAKALLGAILSDLGRITDGVACLSEAVAGTPNEMSYRWALAAALEKAGEQDRALRTLLDGIDLCPADVAITNAAILLCIRRRDFSQAIQLAEKARSIGAVDASTFGMKGHALSSLGDHDAAAIAYKEALKLDPENPYVKHLVISSEALPNQKGTPADYIRTIFDNYADRFESHLISLGYSIPGAIRSALLSHPKVASGLSLGPVLDLGCGTGLVALAIGDLPLASLTGVDLSARMLAHAKVKRLYTEGGKATSLMTLQGMSKVGL